jgi:hypothetical protein
MNITIKQFINAFIDSDQYLRIYDLANDDEIIFEDQISEMPDELLKYRVILFETMVEDDFDGYFGVFIATQNENDWYDKYYDDEE